MEWYKEGEFEVVSDAEILEEYDNARGLMSYYNAAEGNWSKETGARNECSAYLSKVRKELNSRDLVPNKGSFLC